MPSQSPCIEVLLLHGHCINDNWNVDGDREDAVNELHHGMAPSRACALRMARLDGVAVQQRRQAGGLVGAALVEQEGPLRVRLLR